MKQFENILVYVGGHQGNGASNLVKHYDRVFIFEANPLFCESLRQRFGNQTNVEVINAAVYNKHNTSMYFHISKNNGDSSSLLMANEKNNHFSVIKSEEKIVVPTVNLINFLEERKIKSIKTYISDLQGCDFLVLSTLKPLLDKKLIETVQCEVEKNDRPSIYENPSKNYQNKEQNFDNLMSDNYVKISTGCGVLADDKFETVPEEWDEFDVKWKVKK